MLDLRGGPEGGITLKAKGNISIMCGNLWKKNLLKPHGLGGIVGWVYVTPTKT